VFTPRPHGLVVYGGALTSRDEAAVELLARRLTNYKEQSDLASLRMVRALPDGGYVVAQDMGGVFRVMAYKTETSSQEAYTDAVAYIPMLFSGVVTEPVIPRDGDGVGMTLSEMTRERIRGYDEDKPKVPERVHLKRFIIDYNDIVQEFKPPEPSENFIVTQYAQQRPTWYSGAMAEVMQIVGGYGRQDFDQLPEDRIERARMLIPASMATAIKKELQEKGTILPGYTGLPPIDGKYQYDYKAAHTNAVSFDSTDKPWLLRIDQRGVYAMPLPLIPATTTDVFRAYIEEVDDTEILTILDRFGGMPSGEPFPSNGSDFETWRRAGVIIKLCETDMFYDMLMYASTCGWSFNTTGTEGFNTAYEYDEAVGLAYGSAFKMQLKLGPIKEPPPPSGSSSNVDRIKNYLAKLSAELTGNTPRNNAIKLKLAYAGTEALLARANGSGPGEAAYWDAYEADPIADHTGSMNPVGKGCLYHGNLFFSQPQIKFPEPSVGGCVSFDFSPLQNGRFKDSYPRSDTIMFGYYSGDQLKVAKYFREDRQKNPGIESDFEECMIVGSWTAVGTNSPSYIAGNFYTSDFDEREEIAANYTTTHITGKDLGYDTQPLFQFDGPFQMAGTMFRNRYFGRVIKTVKTQGRGKTVALCIPYFCRDAIHHGMRDFDTGQERTESSGRDSITDPWSYRFWTYDFVFHWSGGLTKMSGKPFPKNADPVWVEEEHYAGGGCSDFADQGSWVSGFPADYTWLIHPHKNEYRLGGGGGAPSFPVYTKTTFASAKESGRMDFSIDEKLYTPFSLPPPSAFFVSSPSQFGFIYYDDAARVCIGESEYVSTSEGIERDGTRKHWGYTVLADNKSAHHFIGVING